MSDEIPRHEEEPFNLKDSLLDILNTMAVGGMTDSDIYRAAQQSLYRILLAEEEERNQRENDTSSGPHTSGGGFY
jgi:hypothetical protein